ncbi:Mucin-associated surface protein (MASP) [Trypanosoma cruzi]|uniref:Mucin-associated surface protein (MASP) n=1 Tax=Trypanosoma cruzi TaxID=5693 RepID=A0A2V2UT92_TRYCR|nr:Mucin-associated surface protein (MASP) [Trypanosoma cruzi]
MAMMVTGRVLLVCALCVLCCGAGGVVYAMADRCSEGNGNLLTHMNNAESDAVFPTAECSLLSTQMGLIRAVEAGDEEGAELGGTVTSEKPKQLLSGTTSKGNDEVLTPVPPAPLPTAKLSDHVEKEKPLKTVDSNGIGDTRDPSGGKATESQRQSVGQSSSGSTVTQPGKDHNLNNPSESDASSNFAPTDDSDANIPPNVPERGVGALGKVNEDEDKTKKSKQAVQEDAGEHTKKNKNDNSPTGTLENAAKLEKIPQATSPSLINAPAEVALETIAKKEGDSTQARVNGQSSPEDTVPVQQLQLPQSDMKSNSNSQTEGIASITANSQNETSDGHAETKPPPTANGNFANNEADNSTEDGIPNSDPAVDVAKTRDEQNENKDANPKETPVTATAMKNTTATTGDSDGSTAVSHTTSPLLLLVFVACAAAAAVVAA